MKKTLAEIESALTKAVFSLTPSPHEPSEDKEKDLITFDREETDNSKWKALLAEHLKTAKTFEIHCWNEETEQIHLALSYGSLKEDGWPHGKVITGAVTPAFSEMLLHLPRPTEDEIFCKLTPFFNIFLDDHFYSSHYGTEVQFRK